LIERAQRLLNVGVALRLRSVQALAAKTRDELRVTSDEEKIFATEGTKNTEVFITVSQEKL